MESYVVRIYRRDDADPAIMNGIVEEVGIEGEKSFGNSQELWELLGAGRRRKSSRRVKQFTVKRDH